MPKREIFTTAALAALAVAAGTTAAHAQSAPAPTHTTSWTGTVGEDRFGDARFKVRGRLQYDLYDSEWDVGTADNGSRSYVRRAFLGVQGRLDEHWRYKVDFVLTPGASEVTVDDAFLEYVADSWSIVIGEHNITSPLEDRISSLDIPFNERSSIINAFEYGRRAGVGFLTGGANWSASAAYQGESLNTAGENFAVDEGTALSGRLTFAPIFETTPEGVTLVHLGVHARQREQGDNADFRYRARPFNGRNTRHIDSGTLVGADSDTTLGLEGAVQFGPFGAQAEYMWLDGDATAGEYNYSGYYVDLYWSITGESRAYRGDQGSFGAIAPRSPMGQGGIGHLMLSARYDFIDLSDDVGGGSAGEQAAYGVGLDWIPRDHVRFKLNYAFSDMDRAVGTDDEAQIVTLRTQFDF